MNKNAICNIERENIELLPKSSKGPNKFKCDKKSIFKMLYMHEKGNNNV